jgi:hypothetical protein
MVMAFGSRGNICDNSWGELIGTVNPIVTIDGVLINDVSLLPGEGYFYCGMNVLKQWCPTDNGYPDCPGFSCDSLFYNFDGQEGDISVGARYFSFPVPTASDGVDFNIQFCNREVVWGAGCNIGGSIVYRWRLFVPGPIDAWSVPAHHNGPHDFPDTDASITIHDNPAGIITVTKAPGVAPEWSECDDVLSVYWDIRSNIPDESFWAQIAVSYDPSDVPADTREDHLTAWIYVESSENWRSFPTTVDTIAHVATVTDVTVLGPLVLADCPDPTSVEVWDPKFVADLRSTPCPFSTSTKVEVSIPQNSLTTVEIFSASGRRVCTLHEGHLMRGQTEFRWDGTNEAGHRLAAGIYYLKLVTERGEAARPVLLLR